MQHHSSYSVHVLWLFKPLMSHHRCTSSYRPGPSCAHPPLYIHWINRCDVKKLRCQCRYFITLSSAINTFQGCIIISVFCCIIISVLTSTPTD